MHCTTWWGLNNQQADMILCPHSASVVLTETDLKQINKQNQKRHSQMRGDTGKAMIIVETEGLDRQGFICIYLRQKVSIIKELQKLPHRRMKSSWGCGGASRMLL